MTPKPERSPKYDESLAPTPIEHVEILGEVYSHRAEHRSTAKRRRGKGRVKTSLEIEAYPEPEAVIDETLDVVQERIEDEFEESNIGKLEKMQPEQSVLVAMSQATDALPESGADVKDDVRNQTRSRGTRKKRSVTIENSDCPNSSKA